MVEGKGEIPIPEAPRPGDGDQLRLRIGAAFTAAAILFFFWQLFHIGMDVRAGLWAGPHMEKDINDAMVKSDLILQTSRQIAHIDASEPLTVGQVVNGWIEFYNEMDRGNGNDSIQLDYPPMRSLVLTLWMRHVQVDFPKLNQFPNDPIPWGVGPAHIPRMATADVVQPMLEINDVAESVAALSTFFLVWYWVQRREDGPRWGDPLLLAPAALLAGMVILRPLFTWTLAPTSAAINPPVDNLVASIPFWIFLVLGFVTLVCLARFLPPPFRGPACGMIAATLVWMNPPMLIDGHTWPQWNSWLPAFFLLAALLASLDWWMAAGIVLGIGCMFKGQILFAAPVLLITPLLAGWPGRFAKIIGGLAAGAGVVVSPWLLNDPTAVHYVWGVLAAGLIVCAVTLGGPTWVRWLGMLAAAILVLRVVGGHNWPLQICIVLLCAATLAGPWVLPRRQWLAFGVCVAAAGVWIAGFALNGRFSWWDVGFAYGTRRHQDMQLGAFSLSNLCSLLERHFGWHLHDPAADWPIHLDLRYTLGVIYMLAVVACAIGASIHIRRRDPRFLVALTAPWVLFPTILTQMLARYMLFPAVIGAALIAVSVEMSLMQLLLTMLGCIMLGNQYTSMGSYRDAPVSVLITQPTFPGMAWALLLTSAIFLYCAVTTGRRNPAAPGEELEL